MHCRRIKNMIFLTWFIDMSFVLHYFEIIFWNFWQLYQTKSTDLQLSSSIQQNISDTLQRSFKILSKPCVLSMLYNFSRICLTLALNRSGWTGLVYIHEDSSCLWQYQEQISEPLKEKDDLSSEDNHLDHPENYNKITTISDSICRQEMKWKETAMLTYFGIMLNYNHHW